MMERNNIAFIDGQNLYLGLKSLGWTLDLSKFRVFLRDKFQIKEAYYFLWCMENDQQDLYQQIQKSGFILSFREHTSVLLWKKKGNVDVDIVFNMMKKMVDEADDWNKMVLVSGDWDYKRVVDYLIKKWKFLKLLFPNSNPSSLYKPLGNQRYYYLKDARKKIEYQKKGIVEH